MRQRRNKPPTPDADLPDDTVVKAIPPLPARELPDGLKEWHPRTIAWWEKFWRSPMADRLLESDVEGLYRVLPLVEQYWRSPSKDLLAEIRRSTEPYGEDPMSRRRLGWNVRAEPKEPDEVEPPKAAIGGARPTKARTDPRLTLVKS